jgi:hypothetical protein
VAVRDEYNYPERRKQANEANSVRVIEKNNPLFNDYSLAINLNIKSQKSLRKLFNNTLQNDYEKRH